MIPRQFYYFQKVPQQISARHLESNRRRELSHNGHKESLVGHLYVDKNHLHSSQNCKVSILSKVPYLKAFHVIFIIAGRAKQQVQNTDVMTEHLGSLWVLLVTRIVIPGHPHVFFEKLLLVKIKSGSGS